MPNIAIHDMHFDLLYILKSYSEILQWGFIRFLFLKCFSMQHKKGMPMCKDFNSVLKEKAA